MTQSVTNKATQPIAPPIWQAIEHASRQTGVAFDFLLDQARIESGFRADARAATSSATGLYQFTTQTWLATLKRHGGDHGLGWASDAIMSNGKGTYRVADASMREMILDLRNNPQTAALMAAELAADNNDHLGAALGRPVEQVDLYLAHFLGASGAASFLKAWAVDPSQAAAPLFPKAAAANRAVFFEEGGKQRSLDEIRNQFAAKLAQGNPVLAAATTRQSRAITIAQKTGPMELRPFEPMPQKLSLEFARDAYARLSTLGGTAA